jgi:hypothetical protein
LHGSILWEELCKQRYLGQRAAGAQGVERRGSRCKRAKASTAAMFNGSGEVTKKCGPGQTRRLTGTALGRVIVDGGTDQARWKPNFAL